VPKISDKTLQGLRTSITVPGAAGEIGDALNRVKGRTNSRPLAAGDFANSGWGAGATLGVDANSQDCHGSILMTAGTTPAANPTVTLTFPDGAYPVPMICVAALDPGNAVDANIPVAVTVTITAIKFTFGGTPTSARTYRIQWIAFEP
jgi:hypothetical protein